MYAIVFRALISWIPPVANHPAARILYDVTDPLLKPFQRFQLGGGAFGVDLSPILAYFTLYLIKGLILPALFNAIM